MACSVPAICKGEEKIALDVRPRGVGALGMSSGVCARQLRSYQWCNGLCDLALLPLKGPGGVSVPCSFGLMEERAVLIHGEELLCCAVCSCSSQPGGKANVPTAGLELKEW